MKRYLPLLFATALGCSSAPKPAPQPAPTVDADPLVSACEAGTANSCLIAGDAAEKKGDPARAAQLYSKGCELGDAAGCALAGSAFADAGDADASFGAFETGCTANDATACYGAGLWSLGILGDDLGVDLAGASFFMSRGCELGLASACGELANLAFSGSGGDPDPQLANKLWTQACDGGDGTSCTRLGLNAVAADGPKAGVAFFEKACLAEVNDYDGCAYLGWYLWSDPEGTEQARGVATLESACKGDSAMGCALRANVHAQNAEEELGVQRLKRACELAPAMCETMSASFEQAKSAK